MHYLKELWCRSEKYFTENLTSTELYVLSLIGTVDILASKIIYNLMYFIQKTTPQQILIPGLSQSSESNKA